MAVNRKRTVAEALEHYIECPWSDGYGWIFLKQEFPEVDLEKEMERINGWKRHYAVQEAFAEHGVPGAEEVYEQQKWEMQRKGII